MPFPHDLSMSGDDKDLHVCGGASPLTSRSASSALVVMTSVLAYNCVLAPSIYTQPVLQYILYKQGLSIILLVYKAAVTPVTIHRKFSAGFRPNLAQ